jgi:hypothetical protein
MTMTIYKVRTALIVVHNSELPRQPRYARSPVGLQLHVCMYVNGWGG